MALIKVPSSHIIKVMGSVADQGNMICCNPSWLKFTVTSQDKAQKQGLMPYKYSALAIHLRLQEKKIHFLSPFLDPALTPVIKKKWRLITANY